MKLAVCNSSHLWHGNLPLLLAKPLLRLLYQWQRRAFPASHQTLRLMILPTLGRGAVEPETAAAVFMEEPQGRTSGIADGSSDAADGPTQLRRLGRLSDANCICAWPATRSAMNSLISMHYSGELL